MLGTIGSFWLAPGGWVARCADQSPQWSRRRASCAAADRVAHGLSGRWLPTRKTRLRLACCGLGRRLDNCPAVRARYTAAGAAEAFGCLVTQRRRGAAGRDACLQASGRQASLRACSGIAEGQASKRPLIWFIRLMRRPRHDSPDESGSYGGGWVVHGLSACAARGGAFCGPDANRVALAGYMVADGWQEGDSWAAFGSLCNVDTSVAGG